MYKLYTHKNLVKMTKTQNKMSKTLTKIIMKAEKMKKKI